MHKQDCRTIRQIKQGGVRRMAAERTIGCAAALCVCVDDAGRTVCLVEQFRAQTLKAR
jgi:hypothetical protein